MARGERPIKLGDSWVLLESYLGSASDEYYWGRALLRLGGSSRLTNPLQTPNTSKFYPGDTTAGANVRREEGNNPDRQLRSQSYS